MLTAISPLRTTTTPTEQMDAYQLYSDLNFLNTALDAAYDILTPWGSDKIVLPCRTPNICRLLCSCYYFTGEMEDGVLAGSLISEALGSIRDLGRQGSMVWWDAFCFYEDVVGAMELPEPDWPKSEFGWPSA